MAQISRISGRNDWHILHPLCNKRRIGQTFTNHQPSRLFANCIGRFGRRAAATHRYKDPFGDQRVQIGANVPRPLGRRRCR